MQLLNTLYVTTPDSYLHLDNDTLRVEVEHDTACACRCITSARSSVSATSVSRRRSCTRRGRGYCAGHARQPRSLQGTARRAGLRQCAAAQRPVRQVSRPDFRARRGATWSPARSATAGRYCCVARARARTTPKPGRYHGQPGSGRCPARCPRQATSIPLRGLEGEAARQYLPHSICCCAPTRAHFRMDGRSRRPPRDRFNAVLSFLYSMLMNDCRSALEAAGLDPQVGFPARPAPRPRRPRPGSDGRIPPSRRPPGLTLINRGQLGAGDFACREGGAVLLEGDARKAVVVARQERKQEEITHALLAQPVPSGWSRSMQARLLARTLRGGNRRSTHPISRGEPC